RLCRVHGGWRYLGNLPGSPYGLWMDFWRWPDGDGRGMDPDDRHGDDCDLPKEGTPSPAMDDPQLSHYVWVRSVPLHDRHPRDGQRRDDGRTDGFLKLGMLDAS